MPTYVDPVPTIAIAWRVSPLPVHTVLCTFGAVPGALSEVGITGDTGLALIPTGLAECDDEAMELNLAAVEALLELEDVDAVNHNMA